MTLGECSAPTNKLKDIIYSFIYLFFHGGWLLFLFFVLAWGGGIKTEDFEFQIALHILEAILQDAFGISYVCNPIYDHLLKGLIETWDKQVCLLTT